MTSEKKSSRKPRADAERNRQRLLEIAAAAFAAEGITTSLEEVARRAGVGIGTLYRHFPRREDLVAAVYRNTVDRLAGDAERLAEAKAGLAGLRELLLMCVDYMAAKRLLAEAMKALFVDDSELHAPATERVRAAMSLMLGQAAEAGEIDSPDFDPIDLIYALSGVAEAGPGTDAARRMVDLLINGLRRRGGRLPSRRLRPASAGR